ncbi:MAG: META domain-containing protein [Xanthomonadales bacterium]|jgi:heat shock protein HslJ|nr:META domain-containing protein [Xanthomonadales bacterium]
MTMRRNSGLVWVVLLMLAGCSTGKSDTAADAGASPTPAAPADAAKAAEALPANVDARSLLGTQRWQLLDLPGYAGPIPTETREPLTIQLQTIEGVERLLGHAGCNGFSMPLGINGLALKPGPVVASKMACEHLSFETAYLGVLGKVDALRIKDDELQFLQGEELVLRYSAAR